MVECLEIVGATPRDLMTRLLRQSSVLATGQVAALALSTVAGIAVARMAGPEGRGILSLVTVVPQIAALVGTFGLLSANVFFAQRSAEPVETLLGNGLLVFGVSGVFAVAVIGTFDAVFGSAVFRALTPAGVLCLAFSVLPIFFHRLTLSLAQAARRIELLAVQEFLFQALRCVATIWLLLQLGAPAGLSLALLASAMVVVPADIWALRRIGLHRPNVNLTALKRSLRFGVKSQAAELLQGLTHRFDVLLLSALGDVAQVGIYAAAVSVAELLLLPAAAVSVPLYPQLGTLPSSEAARRTAQASRALLWLVLLLSVPLILASGPLLRFLFGDQFDGSRGPLAMLAMSMAPLALFRPIGAYLLSSGSPGLVALISGAGFLVSLVLDLVWIPKYGALGAASASAVSYVVVGVACVACFRRASQLDTAAILLPQRGDVHRLRSLLSRRGREST